MTHENLDPQSLIDAYGIDAQVVVGHGKVEMSLGQALENERLFCPADPTKREDPIKRVGYLATILAGAGSLRPEHAHLLIQPE